MNTQKSVLALAAIAATVWVTSISAIDRKTYVDEVVDVLQTHARLLEELANSQRFKYSDNLVRHATALEQTFGLLGPMEWHAAQSARLHAQAGGERTLDEGSFEALAEASQKSLKERVRTAHNSMEQHDAAGMNEAIAKMKDACNACHQLLPANAVPHVWGD